MREFLKERSMSIALLSAVSIACVDAALAAPMMAASPSAINETPAIVVAQADPARAEPTELSVSLPSTAEPTDDSVTADASGQERAFKNLSDEAVVEQVLSYIEEIGTLRGDFTQVAPSGAVSTGTFHLRRPNQLRFDYDEPSPLLIVATQGNVYVRDEALETTDFYPIKRTPLRFLLSKKIDLGDARVIAVDRGLDTVAITFASDDAETEGELSIILSAPNFSLQQWVVRDVQNGVTIVTLDNAVPGEKFSNRLFRAPDAGGEFLKN